MPEKDKTADKELEYNDLPPTRTGLGYTWLSLSIDEAMEQLGKFLKRNDARAFFTDVYTSSDSVFRSVIIQLPYKNEVFGKEDFCIQFNRDEGRQYLLRRS